MSKVTEKYQITIPAEVVTSLDIAPGMDVGFEKDKGRFYLVKKLDADPIERWRGVLRLHKTADEIVAEIRGYGVESVD